MHLALILSCAVANPASLDSAVEAFEFGEHVQAVTSLQELLQSNALQERSDVIRAREYLAAALATLGRTQEAATEFALLLSLDPDLRMDPNVFSPRVVREFEKVRARASAPPPATPTIEAPPPEPPVDPPPAGAPKTQPPPPPPLDLRVKPLAPEPHSIVWSFVPFGAGQFANRHPVRGALFATAEVGLFGAALGSFIAFESLKTVRRNGTTGEVISIGFEPEDADRARQLQTVYLATFYTGLAVTALGIIEALISHPGDAGLQAEDEGSLAGAYWLP